MQINDKWKIESDELNVTVYHRAVIGEAKTNRGKHLIKPERLGQLSDGDVPLEARIGGNFEKS